MTSRSSSFFYPRANDIVCGVVGVYSPAGVEDRGRLDRALSSMESRGPDGSGVWWSEDGRVGLGHRRLAINDPGGGVQPILRGSLVGCVNGEFYGLPEFEGESDSVALPILVGRHGLAGALERLRGEFAFLLYDSEGDRLIAARDRFGVKPLFWSRTGEEWWFASRASALWEAGVTAGWCEESFLQAAATQYPPNGGSLFRGIRSVEPGHFLIVSGRDHCIRRYWRVPSFDFSRRMPARRLGEVLASCVEARVHTEHENAVVLSGGIDSASVLALAQATGRKVRAYTIDFVDESRAGFSEGMPAAHQASLHGVSHRRIPLDAATIATGLGVSVHGTEGLCVNGHLVAKMKLAEAIHNDGLKIVLTGEGADELLFGYRHFAPYFDRSSDPPADLAGLGILTTTDSSFAGTGMPAFFSSKYALGRRILQLLGLELESRPYFERLLESGPWDRTEPERARELWLESALRSYILEVLGDGTEMAYSVEGRPPFLDHVLWEECAGAAGSIDGTKGLLREAMRGRVVEEIRTRPKHPFMAPPVGRDLLDTLESRLRDDPHPFVRAERSLKTLRMVRELPPLARLEWEPAVFWVLSSFYLQEKFQGKGAGDESRFAVRG